MRKHTKFFASILVTVLILAFTIKPAFAAEFNQKTLDGVVFIESQVPNEEENNQLYSYTGTGFFVGKENENPQYIVTNCHVIQQFLSSGGSAGEGLLQVAFDKDNYEEAYVVVYNVEKDIALLKLANPTDKRSALKLKLVDKSIVGNSVFAVGYPYTAEETVAAVDRLGKDDATVTGGRISRLITESGSGRQLLQMDVSINHGNSGGPLVDEAGNVVGINTGGSPLDINLNYAINIAETIPLLKNNNIPYELVQDSNLDKYIILAIGAFATLLFIIVVVAIIRKSKKKSIPVATGAAVPPIVPPISQKRLLPVIHSMSSQHAGLSMQVSKQPLLLGRDVAACRIIFKEGTPGVSSKHCQIYYDDNNSSFILTDLKSTYGTFLSNGQKLTSNVPYTLKQKDSFYLGEPDNVIYVDME